MGFNPDILARILLIQNMIGQLPDRASMLSFTCRGLEELPGVSGAYYLDGHSSETSDCEPAQLKESFPLHTADQDYGSIEIRLSEPALFSPYAPFISNLAFMISVFLEERRQRDIISQHKQNLELLVEQRTKQLIDQVLKREHSEANALAEKKRAERYLEVSEALIVELDTVGRLVVINSRGCELLGYCCDELIGRDWFEVAIPIEQQSVLREVHNNNISGALAVIEYYDNNIVCKNGELRTIAWHNVLLRNKFGIITGTLSSGIDITEKLKIEESLQRADRLNAIGILAGGIAHDFNNLLSGIFGHLELASLDLENNKEAVAANLDSALSVFNRARNLTHQLLTFAKGGSPIRKTGPLEPVVRKSALFALSGSKTSCIFSFPDVVWLCDFDENQIGQVIDNMVINADQAMPLGGSLTISAENLIFSRNEHPLLSAGRYVRISIKDTGTGMSPEMLNRIFDPFFTTKQAGSGLGLATCYSVIQQHGGCIDVFSTQGKGSTFHIFLPASVKETAQAAANQNSVHKGSGRFLIMDDEDSVRDVIGKMIKSMGYDIIKARDGKEALERCAESRDSGNSIDGIILDLTVKGGMGGKEAVVEIRKEYPDVPIFAASGYSEDLVMSNPTEYGFTDSMIKPLRMTDLAIILNRHMKKQTQDSN